MEPISELEIRKNIWDICARKINADSSKEIEKEINLRKKILHEKLANVNRIEFFHIFNTLLKEAFYRIYDHCANIEDRYFLQFLGYGTKQWSDDSYNIMIEGSICPNLCLYCYITGIFNHYHFYDIKKILASLELQGLTIISNPSALTYKMKQSHKLKFETDSEKASKSWSKKGLHKLYMSPTSHDIFPENVKNLILQWKKMLEAGHYVLIVSKPLLECISQIVEELVNFKDRVCFRFTLTTMEEPIMNLWEPFAPLLSERINCVRFVKEHGFKISVSMEPYLSNSPELIEILTPLVDEIWLGTMNGFPSEKVFGVPFGMALKQEILRLKELYQKSNVDEMINRHRNNPKIQWKESIVKYYLNNQE